MADGDGRTLVEIQVYRAVWTACWPIVRWLVRAKDARRKVLAFESNERTGVATLPDHFQSNSREIIWIHGSSVGECLSALPLIKVITQDTTPTSTAQPRQVLVTTTTPSARALLTQRLHSNPNAHCIFAPLDHAPCVQRFLDTWQPVAAIWIESELWPNLILETGSRQIPMAILNGRMSLRSFYRWDPWVGRRLARSLMSHFRLVLCQSPDDVLRFHHLGHAGAKYVGDLKFRTTSFYHKVHETIKTHIVVAEKQAVDASTLAELKQSVASRVVWAAGSTHDGEEDVVVQAHVELIAKPQHRRLLLVLIPRHPHRVGSILASISSKHPHLQITLRSQHRVPAADSDVFVVDTMGETQLSYELARVVFVGGSLVPVGGHNILEPLRSGCSVLHGPHMSNFASVVHTLASSQVVQVTAATFASTLDNFLTAPRPNHVGVPPSLLEPIQRGMWAHVHRFLDTIKV